MSYCTHGKSKTKIYRVWTAIKNRCYLKTSKSYGRYGGRGIAMCSEWINSFDQFYKDMGDRPDNYQIDRIDNNGDYEPKNCRWVLCVDNIRNSKVAKLSCDDVSIIKFYLLYSKFTLKQISKMFGVGITNIHAIKSNETWKDIGGIAI